MRSILILTLIFLFRTAGATDPEKKKHLVAPLQTGRMAAEARLDRGLDPRVLEINLSTYILREDNVGLVTLAVLRDSVRTRGAKVRVLIDGHTIDSMKQPLTAELKSYMMLQGVEIREYHSMDWRVLLGNLPSLIQYINDRMHDKIAIFNDDEYIVGGRNMAATFFSFWRRLVKKGNQIKADTFLGFWRQLRKSRKIPKFTDRETFVKGPETIKAKEHFFKMWGDKRTTPARSVKLTQAQIDRYDRLLDEKLLEAKAFKGRKNWRKGLREVRDVRFTADVVGVKGPDNGVAHDIIQNINSAVRELIIQSPWISLTPEMKTALKGARERNVQITVYTGGTRNFPSRFLRAAFEADLPWMLNEGIRVFQNATKFLPHQKRMIVDEERFYEGAFNWDARSQNINPETGNWFTDHEYALEIKKDIRDRVEPACVQRTSSEDPLLTNESFVSRCLKPLDRLLLGAMRPLL